MGWLKGKSSFFTFKIPKVLFVLFLLIMWNSYFAFPQTETECYLHVRGIAEDNMHPAEGVTIKLFKNATLEEEFKTDFTGEFDFKLETNNHYMIETSKPGYISKKIVFITNIPPDEKGVWVTDFAVNLVQECEGVDVSALSQPMDEIKFDQRTKGFRPDKDYNRKMFAILDKLYYELENCHIQEYNSLLDEADDLLTEDKLTEARELYQQAAEKMPEDDYPRKKIYDIVQELQRRYAIELQYVEKINEADKLFAEENFAEAENKYKEALSLKPDDQYANSKVALVQQMGMDEKRKKDLARNEAQQLIEKQENITESLIQKADDYFKQEQYDSALVAYQDALKMVPGDPYINSRIEKLNRLQEKELAKIQKQEAELQNRKYEEIITRADQLTDQKQYAFAEEEYRKALEIKNNDPYATQQIQVIENALAQLELQKAKEEEQKQQYLDAIQAADNFYQLDEFEMALQKYQLAQTLDPQNSYPAQQITQINSRINAQKQAEALNAEEQNRINGMIARADELMAQNQLSQAKTIYQQVLQRNPNEEHSQQQLSLIDQKMQQQLIAQQEEQTRIRQFNDLVEKGNQLMVLQEFEPARNIFQSALELQPENTMIQGKIAEIDNIILEEKQKEQAETALTAQFNESKNKADQLYQLGELNLAKTEYQKALELKPDHTEIKNRIAQIDQRIAQEEAQAQLERTNEQNYKLAISKADDLFRQEKYEEALLVYNNANRLKPGNEDLTQKITQTREKIAKIESAQLAEQQIKQEYDSKITLADESFESGDYNNAKKLYSEALELEPRSVHAKNQLEKIERIESLLASESRSQQTAPVQSKLGELKFSNDNERQAYLSKLSKDYPEGITLEIYREQYKTTSRFVIVRNNEANEFREVKHSWGGVDYSVNDRPITQQYFNQQTKKREGEYYKVFEMK